MCSLRLHGNTFTVIASILAVVGHEQRPQPQYDRWRLDSRTGRLYTRAALTDLEARVQGVLSAEGYLRKKSQIEGKAGSSVPCNSGKLRMGRIEHIIPLMWDHHRWNFQHRTLPAYDPRRTELLQVHRYGCISPIVREVRYLDCFHCKTIRYGHSKTEQRIWKDVGINVNEIFKNGKR